MNDELCDISPRSEKRLNWLVLIDKTDLTIQIYQLVFLNFSRYSCQQLSARMLAQVSEHLSIKLRNLVLAHMLQL